MEDIKLKKTKELIGLGLLGSLTLGLAPFYPEPHILGKVRWVLGGAVGMSPMDWWDFIMHGAPWLILLYGLIRLAILKTRAA